MNQNVFYYVHKILSLVPVLSQMNLVSQSHPVSLTLYCPATYKNVIAISCIVDGSCLSTFSYMMSYTCVSAGLTHLLLQGYQQLDAGSWSLKLQTNRPVLTPTFRTIRLQQTDCSFRYSVFLQLQSWLCVGIFCKSTIFCVSYMRIHILVSLITVTTKVWIVTAMSP
jgi:hypothetical protein